MKIQIKRVYDSREKEDGVRVLVERQLLRGMTSKNLQADRWMKDNAPSDDLRK